MSTVQQWQALIIVPQQGKRGGKRKPLVQRGYVAASTREEATAAVLEELADFFAEHPGATLTVSETRCRFMYADVMAL